MKRWSRLVVALAVTVAMLGFRPETAQASSVLEEAFANTGGSPVTWFGVDCSSSQPSTFESTLIFPSNYATSGVQYPIVVWGNGTNTSVHPPCYYDTLLRQIASWGFFVVAPTTGQTGRGTEMLDAAQLLVDHNNSPASPFYQRLDIDNIGMVGHSQGAVGAINATLDSGTLTDGQVTSVLTLGLPDRQTLTDYNSGGCETLFPGTCIPIPVPAKTEMNGLGAPIFFAKGELDPFAEDSSADWQPTTSVPWLSGSLTGDSIWYAHTRPVHPCGDDSDPADYCLEENHTLDDPPGAYGYVTAWLLYTLWDNGLARAAFVGPGEIYGNTRWTDVSACCLP